MKELGSFNAGFTMFWRPQDPNGEFGNWSHSPFAVDDVKYQCGETYMMYHKALLMGDVRVANLILAEKEPRTIKKLGQQVKPWNEELWKEHRCRIMYEGCLAKFQQNEAMKDKLLSTGNSILVEASPMDKIWGIGLKAADPSAKKIAQWKGLNLLGRVLMQVREDLK